MPVYEFVVQDEKAACDPKVRVATLPDDNAAWNYAEELIRKMQQDQPSIEDQRVMVISSSERVVGSVAFNLEALRKSPPSENGEG